MLRTSGFSSSSGRWTERCCIHTWQGEHPRTGKPDVEACLICAFPDVPGTSNFPGRDSERLQAEDWDVCRLLVAAGGCRMGLIELCSPCLEEKEPRFGLVERHEWSHE